MAFDKWKIKRKTEKEEKKIGRKEDIANALAESNERRMGLTRRDENVRERLYVEEEHAKYLDREQLARDVREARQKLFIQRDKLLKLMINYNREYKYTMTKPDSAYKKKELLRCSTGAKNSAYALAVVENAIDRLDDIPAEHEWRQIMRDLTKGYKTVNAISIGSDLMTRLAFWLQKAKMDIKGNISVNAMEHYYGKSIDKLLEEENIDHAAAQLLVKDEALDLEDEDKILEAIREGGIYTVSPEEVAQAAEDQSIEAQKTDKQQIFENPEETFSRVNDMSFALDDLPSNL